MTDPIYFDADCLSSFLIVDKRYLLMRLFQGRMFLPDIVFEELRHAHFLKPKLDAFLQEKAISQCSFNVGSPEYDLYLELTYKNDKNFPVIGKGEAAAICMTKFNNGVLASNNYRDVRGYITRFNLRHLSTDLILEKALENDLIDEKAGNTIWMDMKNRNVNLPCATFSEFLSRSRR